MYKVEHMHSTMDPMLQYRIYSNRSHTPNSSRPRIVAVCMRKLSGCCHDCKWNVLIRSGAEESWLDFIAVWELL